VTEEDLLDTGVAHPARRYNYWLGGSVHYPADRASGELVASVFPTIRTAAVQNRQFVQRAVGYLANEAGIGQFLDIGTGIPAPGNTHEVARNARVVYVDIDPIVQLHSAGLRTERSTYVEADFRDPDAILGHPDVARLLDLRRPVALLLAAILHFLPDDEQPQAHVRALASALPEGSYLVLSHVTTDFMPADVKAATVELASSRAPIVFRSRTELQEFLDGMWLVPPGLVSVTDWRRELAVLHPSAADASCYGVVARIT
jgi:hypothetical protein